MVQHAHAFSFPQRRGESTKLLQVSGSGGHLQDAHPAGNVGRGVAVFSQQLFYLIFDRIDIAAQQAGLQLVQQVVGDQQGVEFFGAEPETGDFIAMHPFAGEQPTVALAIVFQRGVKIIPQVAQSAPGGGGGTVELPADFVHRNRPAACRKQLVQFQNAVELTHAGPP